MAKVRILLGLLGGCLLAGHVAPLKAAPTVQQMLMPQFQPKQKGVVYSIPSADEYAACEVKVVPEKQPGMSSLLLLDARKQPVCRFTGRNQKPIEAWSYFKDGVEVYREIDTNHNGRPDQFRWLNAGGMKWGQDLNEDGKIDAWKMISPEEVAREVFQACVDRDLPRLQALYITEAEMRALRLPAAQVDKIFASQKEAAKKFQATLERMSNLNDKAQFVRVEGAVRCIPHETAGTEEDLFQFPSRAILFKGSDDKHDWLQTGEMLKVGMAWRLLEGPGVDPTTASGDVGEENPPALVKLFDQVGQIDKIAPPTPQSAGPHPPTVAYYANRVKIVEQIVPLIKKDAEREPWIKQVFDNLSTAAQYSDPKDKRAMERLVQLKDQVISEGKNSNLAAYATFRYLWAKYNGAEKTSKIQEEWLDHLAKFVQTYPRADDTPDALYNLGMGCEFTGKEEEAKRWYHQLHSNFPDHALAAKARGCEERLNLVGQELKLTGPPLNGGSMFDITRLKGKVVAVYYWTSNCSNCITDFARLKQLHGVYGAKGLELVLVNLDDAREDAVRYLQANPVPATHLFQAAKDGGMNSPLATQYGIQALPTLFLVGRDGKVLHRSLQAGELEDALKKAL